MTRVAVLFGNNYPGTANQLSGCVNDVRLVEQRLGSFGFDDVTVLTDTDCTKAGIVGTLHDRLSQLRSGDVLVRWYSGHGSYQRDTSGDEPDARDELWIPTDFRSPFRPVDLTKDDLGRPAGVLTDDELYLLDVDAHKRGVRIFTGSDSCYSGSISRFLSTDPIGDHYQRARFMPPEQFLPTSDVNRSRGARDLPTKRARRVTHRSLLLSGCRDDQVSYCANVAGTPQGIMTYVAMTTLDTLPAGASYLDWWRQIRRGDPPNLPSVDFDQEPELSGSDAMKRWPVFR
jgi:hypothetical protein